MYGVAYVASISLILLIPSVLFWAGVLAERFAKFASLANILLSPAPDFMLTVYALVLPILSVVFGMWAWEDGHSDLGLASARIAALLLGFALIAAFWRSTDTDDTAGAP